MNTLNRKLFFTIVGGTVGTLLVGYLAMTLIVQAKFQSVKSEVLDHNPEITSIESINRLGGWGEFFREYVLIVKKGPETEYRIWTYGSGKITSEEVLID
ncbi:hypothetical protein IMZ31_10985 [Pontibacillus sp. ALD_SL1]|uniref:hypothetical protein n=1 Tax=Pontibacillus sp. ALD_SL1 TaxID=2777185 RepID=UPI001A96070B|nr:hypothetical protein [Pontibacillus sp. ALD_SL1]QSS98635.1 hypothetical protein IMZ31_10985 [Pontibacillus sp. ALD_SL1]